MRFIWAEAKNKLNCRKHRLSFETALLIFDDPFAVSMLERIVAGEERWQTIGRAHEMTILLVAHTVHDEEGTEVIRLISVKKATARERAVYEEKAKQ
jgi:uncharacterized protein